MLRSKKSRQKQKEASIADDITSQEASNRKPEPDQESTDEKRFADEFSHSRHSESLSPSSRHFQRPRFDSRASWADSTRFDRMESNASFVSSKASYKPPSSNRMRSDSRVSNSSRLSRIHYHDKKKLRKPSHAESYSGNNPTKNDALSTITENWNLEDVGLAGPFTGFGAEDQPIRDQLQCGLDVVNEHTSKLKEIEDAITAALSEVWGYWADPIQSQLHPAERVDVQELINTDNELFNKVLTVFAVLCDEISELKVTVENTFYPALSMFGQPYHGQSEMEDDKQERSHKAGEAELSIGRMLPFFQDLSNLVDRCNAITLNILHQLASLYQNYQKLWKSTFKMVHLHPVFDALASLLEVMITIDSLVIDNTSIAVSWDKYKRMMQYVRSDPARYDVTVDAVKQFERLLVSLDQTIMSGQVFQTCIEQDFEAFGSPESEDLDHEESDPGKPSGSEDGSSRIELRSNRVFLDEFIYCISARLSTSEAGINTSTETSERHQLIGTAGLYALHRRLLPSNVTPDPNLYKRFWEMQLKAPSVTLCGKLLWYLPEFLLKYAPMTSKKLQPTDVVQFRKDYLSLLDDAFADDIASAKIELTAWLALVESYFQPTTRGCGDSFRILSIRGNLMLKGLMLAKRVQTMMHTLVNMHLSQRIPMPKRVVRPLYLSIEILKAVEFMLARKNPVLSESIALILQQVAYALFGCFRPLKAKLEASKKFDDTKLDILAAVTVLEEILTTGESFSYTRITILDLAAQIALISSEMSVDDDGVSPSDSGVLGDTARGSLRNAEEPIKLIWKLRLLSDYQRKIRSACDCSFFHWNHELLHSFLGDLYGQPEHANRIQYIISGFLDAIKILKSAQHEADNEIYTTMYAKFIDGVLEEEIVGNLCKDVENDLRLHIHSVHLDHLETPNPKETPDFKVLRHYLDLRPIRLYGHFVDLRYRVTHYLEKTFYNLTTVALHDWKTYGEMRNLANDKYALCLADNHLPMGSLNQGLDILQIMRNIKIFVARYNYNLNQQFFLERRSDKGSRHLNSINIHSIASSIRTHGMGIMNTTVNFTYQFLTKKFDIFSQFLYDEYIKSYLQREKRWYRKNRDDALVDNKYPYTRAFQFNRDIRKLGVSDSGKSFLDQFRVLITEIGNALGYVRMVRSAGMNYCSNAIKFVPDLNHTHFSFEEHTQQRAIEPDLSIAKAATVDGSDMKPLSDETMVAARQLDTVIATLAKNFSENNDYFNILVQVFQNVTNSIEQKHLVNFYHIIPALTINFVETIVQAKDLMYKNTRRRESYFSDDGFAIGVAYILAMLDQGDVFDTLHWFEEVRRKYDEEERLYHEKQALRDNRRKELAARKEKETAAELIDDEEEDQALQMTAKRIELHRREFDLLDWSLNGARIFFKD
uniref:KIAA1033 putative n=1 Tax=Albugo laibachii Nc14 TaxID=890382 RepID=F0WZP8_9STRA|nr:KIAA1033 putative [Albugo laibachii Nc14]|eukprot:CCA26974.1 KIAA1033 putative [Albugo laibachii Nc14]